MSRPNLNRDTFNFVDPEDNDSPEAWKLEPVIISSYSTGGGGDDDDPEPPLSGVVIYSDVNDGGGSEPFAFDFIA